MRRFQDEIWRRRAPAGTRAPEPGSRVATAIEILTREPAQGWIIDLGCGDGSFISRVGGERLGIDLSIVALRRAEGCPLLCADLEAPHIPLRDGVAGACVLLDSLPYVESPTRLMREIHRVLRPGGRILLSVPNARQIRRLVSLAAGRPVPLSIEETPYEGGQRHLFTDRSLRRLLEGAGFRCEASVGLVPSRGVDPVRSALRRLARSGAGRAYLAPGIFAVGRKG